MDIVATSDSPLGRRTIRRTWHGLIPDVWTHIPYSWLGLSNSDSEKTTRIERVWGHEMHVLVPDAVIDELLDTGKWWVPGEPERQIAA